MNLNQLYSQTKNYVRPHDIQSVFYLGLDTSLKVHLKLTSIDWGAKKVISHIAVGIEKRILD